MKRFFTKVLLALATVGASGSAYAGFPGMIRMSDIPDWKSQIKNMRAMKGSPLTRSSETPGEVISDPGEGMPMECTMTYSGFFLNYDRIEYMNDMTASTEVFYAYDGSVYIKDIIPMMACDTYIKGEVLEDGNLEFKFPQTVYVEALGEPEEMWADVSLVYSPNLEEDIPEPVTENNSIIFTMNWEDMSMTMNELPEGTSLSMLLVMDSESMWAGFSSTAINITPGSGGKDAVELPEGVESKPYSYIYDTEFDTGVAVPNGIPDYGYHVDVAFDGDDVYLGGIFYNAPRSWVKGRKEGDKLIFPGNQYLGTMSGIMDFYLMFCKWKSEAHDALVLLPADTEFVFNYDVAAGTLSAADKDVIMLINASDTEIKALQKVEDPVYVYQPVASGAPMAPWNLTYEENSKYGVFDFNLPKTTDDGVLLFSENMYYNIYVNGTIFEYLSDDETEIVDIPYDLDETSIVCESFSSWHEAIVPSLGTETVGVQCVNVWEGQKFYGPLMQIDVKTGEITSGVESVVSPEGAADVEYFDLMGRKVNNPDKGIYIVRKTFKDGTVRTVAGCK